MSSESLPSAQVITPEALLLLLNQRLDNYGHCHSCHFVGPLRLLDEEADDGRNWSHSVPLVCSDGVGSGCKRIAQRILDDALTGYEADIAKLQKKLSEARARQSSVVNRLESAENRVKLRTLLSTERVDDALARCG